MTHTKTYSIKTVKDCRDCPGNRPEITTGEKTKIRMVCVFSADTHLLPLSALASGDVPAWCPLATGDVMVTREV